MNFVQDSDDEEHYEDLPAPEESDSEELPPREESDDKKELPASDHGNVDDTSSSSESSDSEDDEKRAKAKKSSWVHRNLKNSGGWECVVYMFLCSMN
jgi:hypothetical protein